MHWNAHAERMALTELIVPLAQLPRHHPGPRLDRAGILPGKRGEIRRMSKHLAISIVITGSALNRGGCVTGPCVIVHRQNSPIALRPDPQIDECFAVFSGPERQILAATGLATLPDTVTVDADLARSQFFLLQTLLPRAGAPGVVDLLDHIATSWLSWISACSLTPRLPTQEAAESHVRSRLHEPLDLKTLAQLFDTSPATLRRHWHARHGLSPAAWLARERMRLAKELLDESSLPIGSIALRCGYANARSFSAAFRRFSRAQASN